MNLKEYLKKNWDAGVIDHSLRIFSEHPNGDLHGYIHPANVDGDTVGLLIKDGGIVVPCDVSGAVAELHQPVLIMRKAYQGEQDYIYKRASSVSEAENLIATYGTYFKPSDFYIMCES